MAGSPLHVLIIPSWYPSMWAPESGIFFEDQALAVQRLGVRVGVVYPDLRSLRTIGRGGLMQNRFQTRCGLEHGITVVRYCGWAVPKLVRLRSRLWCWHAGALIDRYVARFGKPDLIHAQCTLWGGVAALAAQRRLGIPYVVTEHATWYGRGAVRPGEAAHVTEVLQRAARVLVVSRALGEQLRPYAGEIAVDVVPNVVDTAFFTLPPVPRPLRPFRFFALALLTPRKGIDVLLRAFAALAAHHDDVVLDIGGDGPQRRGLEALAHELGIGSRVRFLGLLEREEVRAAMWEAHCFVLPSWAETFGVVLIEAMATGLPVVATACGGPEDVVTAEVGELIPPGDAPALAAAMCRAMAANPADRGRQRQIRSVIEQRYSVPAVAATLIAHYQSVTHLTSRSGGCAANTS